MSAAYSTIKSPDRVVARFMLKYTNIWEKHFPGLNKRAHWHVVFMARMGDGAGVSSRSIHRALYGSYGTDIRTCLERIKDCERDGFIKVFDAANRECAAVAGCLIGATPKLHDNFAAHCRDTIDEICAVTGDELGRAGGFRCDDRLVSEIYRFFVACDGKWRETCEQVVRKKGLTPAHVEDAMDHLVTYQYWAIVMLLWSASPFGGDRAAPSPALVIDEIISRMWDRLQLGHLAIKERVGNLIRWGFFAEQTIKKHKAVSLTPTAGEAISAGFAQMMPLLADLRDWLAAERFAARSDKVA